MCEITFAYALDSKLDKGDLSRIIYFLDKASMRNEDGFGLFNGDVLYKGAGKFDKVMHSDKILNLFNNSKFIIAHNRYMTSGMKCKAHTHPLKTENLVYVHNGVIWNDGNKFFSNNKLDSLRIGELIEEELSKGKDIVKAMEDGFKKLKGSFSVFIYHNKSNRLFYTRHNADFAFRLIKTKKGIIMYGNTSLHKLNNPYFKTNRTRKYGFNIGDTKMLAIKTPEEDVIYEINKDGLKNVGSYYFDVIDEAVYKVNNFLDTKEEINNKEVIKCKKEIDRDYEVLAPIYNLFKPLGKKACNK